MAKDVFRIPLYEEFLPQHNCSVFQIRPSLDVRTRTGAFVRLPFRFDIGTDFTTIPIAEAERLGIPFTKTRPVFPTAITGKTQRASYLSVIHFSFPDLPQVRESLVVFAVPAQAVPALAD